MQFVLLLYEGMDLNGCMFIEVYYYFSKLIYCYYFTLKFSASLEKKVTVKI